MTTRPRAARLLPLMRDRHWRILDLLADEPLLSTSHVERLAFTTGTPLSRARTCRRALRELTDWRLLHRERAPLGHPGGGSDPATFALTAAGDRLLALRDGAPPPRRVRRPQERGQGSRAHLLALADLHVELAATARDGGAELLWQGEPACWRSFQGTRGVELLKPDAYVELRWPEETRLAWIELDRGTQSVPVTIQAKVRRYCRAAVALAAAAAPIPQILFACTEPRRQARLTKLLFEWSGQEGLPVDVSRYLLASVPPSAVTQELLAFQAAGTNDL